MEESRLASECQKCPYVKTCPNKRMEALAYLPLPETSTIDKINAVGNPYPASIQELSRAINLAMKECKYGLF